MAKHKKRLTRPLPAWIVDGRAFICTASAWLVSAILLLAVTTVAPHLKLLMEVAVGFFSLLIVAIAVCAIVDARQRRALQRWLAAQEDEEDEEEEEE